MTFFTSAIKLSLLYLYWCFDVGVSHLICGDVILHFRILLFRFMLYVLFVFTFLCLQSINKYDHIISPAVLCLPLILLSLFAAKSTAWCPQHLLYCSVLHPQLRDQVCGTISVTLVISRLC